MVKGKKAIILLCVIALAQAAAPQGGQPPGGSPPGPPPAPVNAVKFNGALTTAGGLEWNATHRPTPTSPPGTQSVVFELSLQYTPPPNWSETGNYQWSPLWISQGGAASPQGGMLLVDGDGLGPTAVGYAFEPGEHLVHCQVEILDDSDPSKRGWVTVSGRCMVIGGPLHFAPQSVGHAYTKHNFFEGQQIYTYVGPDASPGYVSVPAHDDGNRLRSYHMQYFGFNPLDGIPEDYQVPRALLQVNATPQPDGTLYHWTISSKGGGSAPFTVVAGGGIEPTGYVRGWVTGAGSFTVECVYSIVYTNDHGTVALSHLDNTTSTPWPLSEEMRTRQVNCHQPTTTERESARPYRPSNLVQQVNGVWTVPNGGTFAGMVDQIRLESQLGIRMPGVWVQERFISEPGIPLPPPGASINSSTGPTWCTVGLEDSQNLGTFYWDFLYRHWVSGATWNTETYRHTYFAATRSVTSGGLNVGSWNIVFTPGPASQLGTVSHTKAQ
jgi:hypothetical protein